MIDAPVLFVFIIAAIGTTAECLDQPSDFFSEPSDKVNRDYASGTHETKRSKRDVKDFDECDLVGLCENTDNYPTELANRLIAQLDNKANFLSMDELLEDVILEDVILTPSTRNQTVKNSIGGGIPVCSSKVEIKKPFQGKNKKGETRMILNSKTDTIQAIKIEVCSNDTRYDSSILAFDEGWAGKCVQSYVYRIMGVIGNNETYAEHILVPNGCVCYGYKTEE